MVWHLDAAIRINDIGYELNGPKTAILEEATPSFPESFTIQTRSGEVVYTGTVAVAGAVPGWEGRYFAICDFSTLATAGEYVFKSGSDESEIFRIEENYLFKNTVADQITFFQGMRSTLPDQSIPKFGEGGSYDVRGGWCDATGDLGKYLSHLSFANFMNPQQIPMVVWSLLYSWELNSQILSQMNVQIREEAAYGADYLMRILDTEGYFYQIIFDRWGWDYNDDGSLKREICAWDFNPTQPDYLQTGNKVGSYQSAFREGAGMAIASLAKSAHLGISGDFSSGNYLDGAKKGYAHLKANNISYCDNREENIIDDYCALMAATELFRATSDISYLTDSRDRAQSLMNRFDERGFFFSDNNKRRPFYHAADEGLPVIALINFLSIDSTYKQEISTLLQKWKNWNLWLNSEVNNPFGYARMAWTKYDPSNSGTHNPDGNLAHGKNVTVSSSESGRPAADAVDGSYTTRWGSILYSDADLTCDEWIIVDLENPISITGVTLFWEAAYASAYTIDVSTDGISWTTLFSESAGDGGTDLIPLSSDIAVRYVRMHATKRVLQYAGVSLYEFQVNGSLIPQEPDPNQNPLELTTSFFQPHTNETGYWWQGENARIASISAAFLKTELLLDPSFRLGNNQVSSVATAQLDWILGKNPFGICMMYGYGTTNYPHYPGKPGYAFDNVTGGICNGITSDDSTETDLAFMPFGGTSDDWRWIEQWLPHNAWYLIATATLSHVLERPISTKRAPVPKSNNPLVQVKMIRDGLMIRSADEAQCELTLIDIKGRAVVQKRFKNATTLSFSQIPVSHGIYCAVIKSGEKKHTFRFTTIP